MMVFCCCAWSSPHYYGRSGLHSAPVGFAFQCQRLTCSAALSLDCGYQLDQEGDSRKDEYKRNSHP